MCVLAYNIVLMFILAVRSRDFEETPLETVSMMKTSLRSDFPVSAVPLRLLPL